MEMYSQSRSSAMLIIIAKSIVTIKSFILIFKNLLYMYQHKEV